MKIPRNPEFWSASVIILVTLLLMVVTYLRWFPLNFAIGPFRFTHWLSWIGTLVVVISTPIFYVLRRRYPKKNPIMTRTHLFGNLLSFMLISVHFAQQMSRSVHPEDKTGFTMYIVISILVASGFIHRFQLLGKSRLYPPHRNRFIHISMTTAAYIIVGIHILHNLGFL